VRDTVFRGEQRTWLTSHQRCGTGCRKLLQEVAANDMVRCGWVVFEIHGFLA
jgi:hypothetical protein